MKKICMLCIVATISVNIYAQTIINYGKYTVSKEEFLRAYNKNKTPITDKEKSIRDYLELYTNFKLKVKAAEALGLDSSEQLKIDQENFSSQIEESYMNDEQVFSMLMDQAFQRSQLDLHVLHFSIPVEESATPGDTTKIFQMVQNAFSQLQLGSTDYRQVASSAGIKFSDMGFVTVFSLPYHYENIIYQLKPGEVSAPVRSKKAWHIFKLIEQRKTVGKWKIAQILFSFPADADQLTRTNATHLADSVYALITNGADFATLARKFSEDKLSYLSGGEMPEFSIGKFDYSFEKELMQLKKAGDVSRPFVTSFGIHIVKLLEITPTPYSKEDEAFQFELKQKIMQDDRVKLSKDKFVGTILLKTGFKVVPTIKEADLFRDADSVMNNTEETLVNSLPISKKIVINFQQGNVKGVDWLLFVRAYKSNPENYKGETNAELWENFKTAQAIAYYKKNLGKYNSEFRHQLEEFKEGNMLFEVMEKMVWSKASIDSVGLKKYYEAHQKQYTWAASADVLIMNTSSEATANETIALLKQGNYWKDLIQQQQGTLQGDSGRYELTQINGKLSEIKDSFSPIVKNPDDTYTFMKYYNMYDADQQRSFEDARGLVINDYQGALEKQWVEELRKKYPVKINEVLVQQLIKQ